MTYPQALQYLESFINYEKIPAYPYKESLKLERIKGFLTAIGNPQDALRCIHVAGTKGKGSTCAFLTYILRAAGYKVGLYTSPHLSDFRERIRILKPTTTDLRPTTDFEGMISKGELTKLVVRLKPTIDQYNRTSKYGPLSFFEAYTALAFVYFKERRVDFAVLETGLGGRLDATSVANPLVCAITPISYEHTQKLGNTLREIAQEKAGIIKGRKVTPSTSLRASKSQSHKLTVISAPQGEEAREVIRKKCKDVGAKLYEVGRDIKFGVRCSVFGVRCPEAKYANLRIRLLGRHQLINATVAVAVIEVLRNYNINVGVDSIRRGLYNTVWPGRCEVIAKNPLIVLDGAQNVVSAKVLKEAIKENFSAFSAYGGFGGKGGKYKKLILVLGISNDKDILGICQELCPLAGEIILTQASNPRAASVDDIAEIIGSQVRSQKSQVIKTENVKEAMKEALEVASKKDLILVTGSLFVAGEARKFFKQGRF